MDSLLSNDQNLFIELYRLFLEASEVLSGYHIKIEPKSSEDERSYQESYAESALKFFIEFDKFLQGEIISSIPKNL